MSSAIKRREKCEQHVHEEEQQQRADTMRKKLYLFVGLIAVSIATLCVYLSLYYDAEIQDTYRKTYMIHEADDANVTDRTDERVERARELRKAGVKSILLWNTLFGDRNFYFGKGDVFRGCPVDRCEIFNDRGHLHVEDYDAILFHGNELTEYEVPPRRRLSQMYVYVNLESPANRAVPYEYYENYFNLTMTYRLDSDVMWPYGVVKDAMTGHLVAPAENPDWDARKNGMVALVSCPWTHFRFLSSENFSSSCLSKCVSSWHAGRIFPNNDFVQTGIFRSPFCDTSASRIFNQM